MTVNFGTVAAGTMKKDSLLLSNEGTDTLRISSMSSTNPRFAVSPATITLAPSSSAHLVITFGPADTSNQTGSIVLLHNAFGSPDSIAVLGKGSIVLVVNGDNSSLPKEYALGKNYPNPFNPATAIEYALPRGGLVSLKVYNMLGQEVAVLANREMPAGVHRATWNAQSAPSGVYFYRLTAAGYSKTEKMILLK
jgi:hypothetical protein